MNKVLIIAEAGVNHNGKLEIAKKLALIAKNSGADIVKFQTAKLESLVTDSAPMAEYQKKNIKNAVSQKEMIKTLLLPYEDFIELSDILVSLAISKNNDNHFHIDELTLIDDKSLIKEIIIENK